MFPESEKWTIKFKDRKVFEEFQTDSAYDIGHSDMILLFDNEADWLIWEGVLLWNCLKENEDYVLEGIVSGNIN